MEFLQTFYHDSHLLFHEQIPIDLQSEKIP